MSPRTAEANEVIHEERRRAILDAALNVFVERGFEGTRIQEIADRSGLSYGLVYHYFPTKEAVFTILVDLALEGAGSLLQTLPKVSPPEAFGAFAGYALRDPSPRYFALIVEALSKRGVPPGLAARAKETIQGFKATILEAGSDRDPIVAATRAEGILAILLGASIMRVCGVSDGDFAPGAATALAASSKE